MVIKPNRSERLIIVIVASAAIGFTLGVLSMEQKVKEKDEQVEELLGAVEDLLK